MQCQICGERTWNTYCSNACKQKAYRARKKQQKIAKELAMKFNEQMCYERMCEAYETFPANFRDFKIDYGQKCAIDMMYALANIIDNYDPDGE